MFPKLVENLSFSPGIVSQMTYYARRLAKENLTRRLSVIMGIGVFLFQIAAIVLPPGASNAAAGNGNDIIFGGFTDKAALLQKYDGPSDAASVGGIGAAQLRFLLDHFKIDRNSIANSVDGVVSPKDMSAYSLGRNPEPADVQTITVGSVFGDQVVYLRPLSSWGTNGPDYQAIRGTTTDGQPFALLKRCGNVVVWKLPAPPPPILQIHKTMKTGSPAAGSTVHRGDVLTYHLNFKNVGASQAIAALIEDAIPTYTTAVSQSATTDKNSHGVDRSTFLNHVNTPHYWWADNVLAAGGGGAIDMSVVVNADAPNGAKICNQADIRSFTTGPVLSEKLCHTVGVTTPPPPGQLVCQQLKGAPLTGTAPLTVKFDTVATATGTKIVSYNYDFLGNGQPVASTTSKISYTYNQPGTFKATVVVTDGHKPTAISPACSLTITVKPTPGGSDLTYDKTAFNLTKLDDQGQPTLAGGTTVSPSDKVHYDLSVKNTGGTSENAFIFSENISDILEYADVIDNGGGTLTTTATKQQILAWPAQDIAAGAAATHSFTVQIKNPVPDTPQGVSNRNSFDLTLDNVFHGVAVQIKVPTSPPKQLEKGSTNLPQTGAGTSLAITFGFVALALYFYLRNRQLVTEIKTLSNNYHPGAM